ncbi:MAG: HsdR family type I site-specific deoxyribonuclease [Acidobacteria bacterium]|nr:HsdR family type I site-specific deoxyribonuclease [Acidobacteriota bacterium]
MFQTELNYKYLGNWQYRRKNSHIEEELLSTYLQERKYSQTLITKALYQLNKAAGAQSKNLYYINKEVYSLLRYGVKVKEDIGENNQTVWLIDWENPLNNHFAIAEEVTVKGQNEKRPDIVLYVNGIALGVIELKRSVVSVSEGIRQNLDNQKELFIKHFFSTIQLIMAGNDTEGLRYGTIDTTEKNYLTWKEDDDSTEKTMDNHIKQVCDKKRFLEILHGFIVFDRGIKKLCRPHQYFGVKAGQKTLKQREGGIIWHTQGSGKSLTMVWLTKWIRENIQNSRVLIITDREELDNQIEKVFLGVEENIYRTKSGKDLMEKLNSTTESLLCSLIHKFGNKGDMAYEDYIEELKTYLSTDFKAKGDIYVFVDECHRTQSGKLHEAMKKILPNAIFIGFTGTPLLKQDKQSSLEVFGKYIHTYKFNEAVKDKVILDLRYEARDIEQNLTSKEKIWLYRNSRGGHKI